MVSLSIITIVFNGERFIEPCIQNVIAQSCPAAEHLIIDGGSSDGTLKIIKKYAEKYKHIRWVSGKDQGQSDAMNKGVALAKGSVIGFLNVDDYYSPGVLNEVLGIFDQLPEPSIVLGDCTTWNDDEQIVSIYHVPKRLRASDLLLGPEVCPHPPNPSAYFYHKCLHEEIKGFDLNDHYTMDLDFLYKALEKARVHCVNKMWGNFRFIRGTKTYQDCASGLSTSRIKMKLLQYRKKLVFSEKLKILPHFLVWNALLFFKQGFVRTLFYAGHPKEIVGLAKRKLLKVK